MNKPPFALIVLISSLCTTALAAGKDGDAKIATVESYHVSGTFQIGGEGRWDFITVDPAARLLYVPRQTHVQALKEESGELVADLPNTPGVHGVALAPEFNRGFISNGTGNSVTIFDLKTNKALAIVPAGKKPDAILYDAVSKKVLCFNGNSNDATVIDAAVDPAKPIAEGTIALNGKPEVAVADGLGHVYVNLEDKSSIAVIDVKAMRVTGLWKIEGGDEPTGLAIDVAHHRLFAGCDNEVMAVVDIETGKTLATLPIGKGVDGCEFDPAFGVALASCGDGTLTAVKETSPGKFSVIQTLKTRKGARTLCVDPRTHAIYLPTAEMQDQPAGSKGRPTAKPGSFMIVNIGFIQYHRPARAFRIWDNDRALFADRRRTCNRRCRCARRIAPRDLTKGRYF
jgi:DNA-binding beta-propeller fold protein YncE